MCFQWTLDSVTVTGNSGSGGGDTKYALSSKPLLRETSVWLGLLLLLLLLLEILNLES